MRINSGKWKGREIKTVPGLDTRPTPDIVKQAIFNIIGGSVKDAEFCDIFAGTGSVAFEALSRGAKHATLIENARPAIEVINRNAETFGCKNDMTLMTRDAGLSLKMLASKRFDYIFFDPPYNKGFEKGVLEAIKTSDLLKDDGTVIIQYDMAKNRTIELHDAFETVDERRYGRNGIIFLKLKKGENIE